MGRHVILGDGAAGMAAAQAIRRDDPTSDILVVSPDPTPFYYRAALTNHVLGACTEDELTALPAERWDTLGIRREADHAIRLDPAGRRVELHRNGWTPYDALLIATGARARRPEGVPGQDLSGLHVLRTLADAQALMGALRSARHAVVVGGGILGIEAAYALTRRGVPTRIVHRGPWLLERVLDRTAGELLAGRLEAEDVQVLVRSDVAAFEGTSRGVRSVRLKTGESLEADVVVLAIGNVANTDWLEGSGMALEHGRLPVDRRMRVRDAEGIWAAGDVAAFRDPDVPFANADGLWQPAAQQGAVAGLDMARPTATAAREYRPGAILNATRAWDLDLASLGDHVEGPGESVVTRAFVNGRPLYKRLLLRDGRLVGALLLGDRREATALRRLMNLRGDAVDVRSVTARLLDPKFDLDGWVAAQERAPGVKRWNHEAPLAPIARPAGHITAQRTRQRTLGRAVAGTTGLAAPLPPPRLRLMVNGKVVAVKGTRVRLAVAPPYDAPLQDPELGDTALVIALEGLVWMARVEGSRRVRLEREGRAVKGALALQPDDVLRLGRDRIVVSMDAPRAAHAPARQRDAFLLGPLKRHALVGPHQRLGSARDNDIVVQHASIAAHHAQLQYDGDGSWRVLPLAGARTRVNDVPVAAATRLAPGDALYLGSVCFTFHQADESPARHGASAAETVLAIDHDVACLLGVEGPHAGLSLLLQAGAQIGRGAEASVRVDDPLLSRVHLRIEPARSGILVADLGSANGTRVRGEPLVAGRPVPLAWGERIQFGRTTYVLQRGLPDDALPAPMPAPASARAETVLVNAAAHRLELAIEGRQEPAIFPLLDDLIRIGRSTGAEISLADRGVSRDHARLTRTPDGGYALSDAGSRFGTRLDGQVVAAGTVQPLADGSRIEVGHLTLTYRRQPIAPAERARAAEVEAAQGRLELLSGHDDLPATWHLRGSGPWILGRDARRVTHHVPVDTVSRTHLQIERREGGQFIARNLSTLGPGSLLHNRLDVREGQTVRLADGDALRLQVVELRFHVDRTAARLGAAPPVQAFEPCGQGPHPLERSLTAVVQREFEACIGCHECMRACPLPDARQVTIAALNAYGTLDGEPGEIVQRFVRDCTQCHACVPVCPADLRRSRMVLWNKLKHVPAEEERLALQIGLRSAPGPWPLGALADRLLEHPVFGALRDRAVLLRLLGAARLRQVESGEDLVQEGSYADAVWLILDGQMEAWVEALVRQGGRRPVAMVTLGPGHTLGERAVLGDQPSEATYRARERTIVLGFSRYALSAARTAPTGQAFGEALDRLYTDRSREDALARLKLSEGAVAALQPHLRPERHGLGDPILDRVEAEHVVGIVARGFVREVRRHEGRVRWANYLRPGDVFGGPDRGTARDTLLHYEAASVVEVFLLDRERLGTLAQGLPELDDVLARGPSRRQREGSRIGPDDDGAFSCTGGTGILQAHQLLVIDARLCVDCDNCVQACERRHGAPRLDRRGAATMIGPWQVPTSCYHCVDPLCLFCSVNGIVREPSGEIRIVEENCIGCGLCAERCPYDNIFMRPVQNAAPSLLQRLVPRPLQRLFGVRDGKVQLEDHERLAVKCDLCHDHADGPACVRSCPTGAARRDQPAHIFGIGNPGA